MNPPILIPLSAPGTTRSPCFLASLLSAPCILRCPPTTQTPTRPRCHTGYSGGNNLPPARAAASAPKPPAVEHRNPARGIRPYISCISFRRCLSWVSLLFPFLHSLAFFNILVFHFGKLGVFIIAQSWNITRLPSGSGRWVCLADSKQDTGSGKEA